MLKSSYVLVELGKSPSLTIVVSTGRNHIDRLTIKLSSSVTFRCQDVVLLEGKGEAFMLKLDGMTDSSDEPDYSFECNKDVITMGNIQGDKAVSFLVPHSDASAFTAMVRLLSSRQKENCHYLG